jgi:hypothetical protein
MAYRTDDALLKDLLLKDILTPLCDLRATAITRTSLLALDAQNLHALMYPSRLAERIHDVVRHRRGGDVVTPQGDLASGELEEREGVDYAADDRAPLGAPAGN